MIKEILVFKYSEKLSYKETEQWFFEQHARLVKKIPHLVKYVTYRSLHLPENDFFPPPQFSRMEERWWPSRETFKVAHSSDENQKVGEDLEDPKKGPRLVDVKRILLEGESNIQHPAMTGNFQITMNELNGKPHVKSLWCFNYIPELDVGEAESWYLNHHTLVAARNFNLVRYVTYRPANELGVDHGFVRFTELCWRDWETMLNDFTSNQGQEVLEDNKNEKGVWRLITETPFLDHPHVVGNEVVFI